MISFVTWLWHTPGYRSTYTGAHVNALRRMIARHYAKPHRFICVTNEPHGIEPGIAIVPAWNDFHDVQSPHGRHAAACYRRLRMWHEDIGERFGERFASLDLDLVAVDDVTPIFDRPEPLLLYRDPFFPKQYNGSIVLMDAGVRPDVWSEFNPNRSPQVARGAGFMGSDQGWLSYRIVGAPMLDTADGVYSYRKDIERGGVLPAGARLVVFHGRIDPWSVEAQRLAWVREHWGAI